MAIANSALMPAPDQPAPDQPALDQPAPCQPSAPLSEPSSDCTTDETERDRGAAQIAWMLARQRQQVSDQRGGLLFFRFLLTNLVAASLVYVAWSLGLVEKIVAADSTHVTLVIAATFLLGLGICGVRIWQTSRELDRLRNFDPLLPSKAADYLSLIRGLQGEGRSLIASSFRLKLTQRISLIRHLGNSLVLLGLIGTVIGFVIALSGIEPDQASDVKAIAPMVSTMIEGMSTALYTTLVGALLNLWLMTNHQMLAGGTVKLISGLIEFGEAHGRS